MLYDQRWFHVEIPSAAGGGDAPSRRRAQRPLTLEWRDQGEATLYVDGVPYYGFDPAHRYVALPAGTREVWIEGYCCQSGIWCPGATGLSPEGSLFGGAFVQYRDDLIWDCVQELGVLFDLMMALRSQLSPRPASFLNSAGFQAKVHDASPVYRRLLRLLNCACTAYERAGPVALREALVAARAELKNDRPVLSGIITGHAHIDLVWIWPERMGEAKAVHTFATVNRLMSQYPEFRFAYSQPASYRAVERRAPKLAALVKQQIARGTWEATGGMDVESDTLLPCGEALARSLMLGQADFARLRGAAARQGTASAKKDSAASAGDRSRLVWLPDVFGYSVCLPQLMRLTGIDCFFTTKLTWCGVNRFPYSSFVWRGNDGSEVVSHVTQNVGYTNQTQIPEIEANARGHSQSHLHREFLHPTGYGDGGGGPTEEHIERVRRLSGLCDLPELRWDHPENFFARLSKLRDQLPVHQGECYLEYHRGVYTTHGDFKAAFRGTERALQVREAVAAAIGEVPDLVAPWRRLIMTQFHDFIPGSSIAEVYAEGKAELSQIINEQLEAARARLAASAATSATASRPSSKTVSKKTASTKPGASTQHWFNPLALPWRGWLEGRWYELPPLASVPVTEGVPARVASDQQATASVAKQGVATLRSDRVQVWLTRDGRLAELVIDGREIAFSAPAAVPVLYPDNPANYDAWDIDRDTLDMGEAVSGAATITVEAAGDSPEQAAIFVRQKLGEASEITLRYEVRLGEPFLRLSAEVDWHETHKLLRLHFPTEYRGRYARFAAPYGSVLRGQQPGEPITEAQWEVPGSRWAAVSLDSEREGLALVTEAKYGFSARDGELAVSLLRAASITAAEGSPFMHAAPPHLSRYQPPSPFSDQGHHTISLALTSYSADLPQEQHPAALADMLFTLPVAYRGAPVSAGLRGVHDAPTLVPAWAMPVAKDAWVLRLHEVGGARGTARLDLAEGFVACPTSIEGEPEGPPLKKGRLDYAPYKILSVRISRA
ncbi:hypothetical protein AXK11_00085 [Cephaloticoccus primus]|uniref:Glycoside hydrolase family 38 central domain-containing protein n=2 Tax=Cephaloticoccus primus TaxID=1548207 RepID=A0A139ST36_9BACT|nr:hypothetical protein AXK11_00085 [Cephaloticoccus primus]